MKLSTLTAAVAALAVVPMIGVVVLFGAPSSDALGDGMCATSGSVPGLDGTQAAIARTIDAVAHHVVTPVDATDTRRAVVIALMAAYQESKLRDLSNPAVPGSENQPGANGSGHDHDSVGIFQQRASWFSSATDGPGMGNDRVPHPIAGGPRLDIAIAWRGSPGRAGVSIP